MRPDSPAIQLLAVLWNGRQEATGHSWLRLNQAMRDGLMLAVSMGLLFYEDDFAVMSDRFRFGYWCGESLEDFYRLAIAFNNRSSWKAYETYMSREPFVWPNTFEGGYGGGGSSTHNSTRLVVGSKFVWQKHIVTVTSINDKEGYVTACQYRTTNGKTCRGCGHFKEWPKRTISRRFKITHEDLKAAKKAMRPKKIKMENEFDDAT
jgi:hypothetical protein